MSERSRKKKRPRDMAQLAKSIVDEATGQEPEAKSSEPESPPELSPEERHVAAVALGRLGGLKGGRARATKLTAEQRRESARKASKARWKRDRE